MALCACGCGGETRLAPRSDAAKGWVRGQSLTYIFRHKTKSLVAWVVDEGTGCWVWQRHLDKGGYANRGCYRQIYTQHKGPIPHGMQLDHLCRNRACVNPDHLEPVTAAENSRRGTSTKLTRTQAIEIRRLRDAGVSLKAIAKEFNTSVQNVVSIAKRNSWKDVA